MSQFRCKDSAKNRFSKEKENKLSFLSVRFLFKSKTKPNKKTLFLFFCWDAAYHTAPSAHKQSHSVPARFKHHYPHGRPRRINNRTSCVKQSQLSCQREQSIKLAWMLCRVQPRVNKVNFLLRQIHTSNPLGANFRASESKASSSLECSAERSRKSTKLKLVCEYRTAGLPVKSSPSEKGRI